VSNQSSGKSRGSLSIIGIAAISSLSSPARFGLTYSHTISLSGVTSKALPPSDSVIRVFPFGRRWLRPYSLEKNGTVSLPRYNQKTSSVRGSNSSTSDTSSPAMLLKISSLPFSRNVGLC